MSSSLSSLQGTLAEANTNSLVSELPTFSAHMGKLRLAREVSHGTGFELRLAACGLLQGPRGSPSCLPQGSCDPVHHQGWVTGKLRSIRAKGVGVAERIPVELDVPSLGARIAGS